MLCGGKGWEVRRGLTRERTYVYLQMSHVDIWQKPTQHYKAVILQLKINKFFKKEKYLSERKMK